MWTNRKFINNRNVEIEDKKKIKIAFVVWTLKVMSGSEKVVYDIVRKLERRLYSIAIISLKDGPMRAQYEKLEAKVFTFSKNKSN